MYCSFVLFNIILNWRPYCWNIIRNDLKCILHQLYNDNDSNLSHGKKRADAHENRGKLNFNS